jgi:hypothetical protein
MTPRFCSALRFVGADTPVGIFFSPLGVGASVPTLATRSAWTLDPKGFSLLSSLSCTVVAIGALRRAAGESQQHFHPQQPLSVAHPTSRVGTKPSAAERTML